MDLLIFAVIAAYYIDSKMVAYAISQPTALLCAISGTYYIFLVLIGSISPNDIIRP